jgi:hypothetical protein
VKMLAIESICRRFCSVLIDAMLTAISVQAASETMVGNRPVRQLYAFPSGLDTQ